MKIKIAFLLCFALSLNAAAQKIFTAEKHGFSIQEPNGWFKELNREPYFNLDHNNGRNIITFYKHDRGDRSKGNSMINISVESINGKTENFIKKMLKPGKWNASYYLDHTIVQAPELVQIDGKTAITGTVRFRYNSHSNEKDFKKKIYYIISNNKLFKAVSVVSALDEADLKLFEELVQTIKIGQ